MRRLSAALLLLLPAAWLAAAPGAPLLTVEAKIVPGAAPGTGTLVLDARLARGWHANSHRPSEDYLIPTAVKLDPAPGVETGEARYPDGVLKKFAFSEKPLSVYEDRFQISLPLTWSGRVPTLSGTVDYQACNDKQCNPPATAAFHASLSSGAAGAALRGGALPLSQAPKTAAAASTAAAGASEDFGSLLERKGFPFVLVLLFLGGLALNLTPCVYPVIPLTVGFFGGQAAGDNRRVLRLAAVYVLGMATMYSALGVTAALSGKLFGAALQSAWVLGGVAVALALLSLSMFGLYDLRMPSFLMRRAGARAGGAGAYAMGLLVGIVAAPCVGPFVLGLLAFVAARQNAALGFLFFFVLSLGLGLPYLFLAAFSGSLSRLPRAGVWMDGVKKIFGWVLLAMAAYFLRTVVPAPLSAWLLPGILTAGALAMALGGGGLARAARAGAAVVFLAAAALLVPRRLPASAAPDWRSYDAGAVASAGRPAVVDFSASWCIPCLELDQKTFSDARVRRALSRRALFKADMTRSAAPEVVALAERYEILGVPTVIFLDAAGREREDLRLVGFEGPQEFLTRLEKAP